MFKCKVCNTEWYCPYWVVCTNPPTTGRYRRLGLFPPSIRWYQPKEKEEEREEEGEGEPGDPTPLSLNDPDLSPPFLAERCR
ncbi:hypothetical protein GW17_00000151 [Ensete ventricosum]|nr:hypothetical protein GW17_00000151 [Ensete ventricosum]